MKFRIDGKIKGKARPRVYGGVAFTPQDSVSYENYVRWLYRAANGLYHQGAIKMTINAYYELPASKTKTDRAKQKFLIEKPYPTKKPDADNIAKIIADALNKIAYHDDSQIVDMIINRRWSEAEEYVDVEIGVM